VTETTIWPPSVVQPRFLTGRVNSSTSAESIPGVGRAVMLHQLASIMRLELWRGNTLLPTPRMLTQIDPSRPGMTWFVQQNVRDWLLEGNALGLITVRSDVTGWPLAVRWAPAWRWNIISDPFGGVDTYYLDGRKILNNDDVVHVRRGADPLNPARGVGIVEQYVRSLNVSTMQLDAESEALAHGGVPSVAVIAPQSDISDDDVKEAGDAWDQMFSGPGRRPGIFPKGTTVTPLSWSPTDAQMIEARKMNTIDIANMTGIDPYWFGSTGSSHQYKSPGPMWLTLLKTPLEAMLQLFEDAWSAALVPNGQTIRFRRRDLTSDDLETSIRTMAEAKKSGLYDHDEARDYLGMGPGGRPELGLGDTGSGVTLRDQLDMLGVAARAGVDPNEASELVGLDKLADKFIGYPASVLPYDRNPVKDPTAQPPVVDPSLAPAVEDPEAPADPSTDPTVDPTPIP